MEPSKLVAKRRWNFPMLMYSTTRYGQSDHNQTCSFVGKNHKMYDLGGFLRLVLKCVAVFMLEKSSDCIPCFLILEMEGAQVCIMDEKYTWS
jgi:hypothetical protein